MASVWHRPTGASGHCSYRLASVPSAWNRGAGVSPAGAGKMPALQLMGSARRRPNLSRIDAVENGERTRPACCRRRRAVGLVPPFCPHRSVKGMVGRRLRRDATNHTPEACAPHSQLHRSGLFLSVCGGKEWFRTEVSALPPATARHAPRIRTRRPDTARRRLGA